MSGPAVRRKSRSMVLQRSRRGDGESVRSRAADSSARDTARSPYSVVGVPVSGTATRTFFSLIRVALPVR